MFGDTPKKQDVPETITYVSAGDSYTIALGQSGIVYFYGGIKERILLSGGFQDIRGVLDIYFNQTVTMVQAQPEHFLVLTEKKQLFGYGRNEYVLKQYLTK
jgi:alpha-tubulin suppressor-like RCC1 family protein